MVGFTTALATFCLIRNDGTTTATAATLGTTKDSAWNTLELSLNATDITAKVNNNAIVTRNTQIPGLTTTLYLNIQLQVAEAAAKTLDIAWCDVRAK